ncbi:MAG: ribosome small subunit-dependent GTPase A [Armatimonadetes bacterium]|nr:ribosome small subunit-dependent GTPase A [Armatimonadota bacterium]
MSLEQYGWTDALHGAFRPYATRGLEPGRVVDQQRGRGTIAARDGLLEALAEGKLLGTAEAPVVGDWVAFRRIGATAVLTAVLPRRTRVSRKQPGRPTEEQVLAANVDTLFVLLGLDGNYRATRLERYLLLSRESGAEVVFVLTKADCADDPGAAVEDARARSGGAPVAAVSVVRRHGVEALAPYLLPAHTIALLGSSGVGKSTLLNHLMGADVAFTHAVREQDGRGRHTTTHRELFTLPGGALVIDTPGLRELAPWAAEDAAGSAFADIDALAEQCRFRDCGHQSEPGCAVLAAVAAGRLDERRLASHRRLTHEAATLDAARAERERRARDRAFGRRVRKVESRP